MLSRKRLMKLGAVLSTMMCLMSCQTVSSNAPEVVEDTALKVEADRCSDWEKTLNFAPDGPEQHAERWESLPVWAKRYLLAVDAAWLKACGSD